MSEALTERDLQYQNERRRHNTLLALVGLFLLILGLGGWVVSLAFSSTSTAPITRTISSSIIQQGLSGGGCQTGFCVTPSSIYLIIPQGQSIQYVGTLSLDDFQQTVGSWSGITSQGSDWFSISPTKGDFSRTGRQIAIMFSGNTWAVGTYRGAVKFIDQSGSMAGVDVYVKVIPASQKDYVAYTPVSDLTIVASWPHLIKDHAVNITISLLSKNLSRGLLRAAALGAATQAKLVSSPLPEAGNDAPFGPGGGGVDQPLEIALEPDEYELITVFAHLNGTSFVISPSDPPPQIPPQKMVSFHWNILPKETGLQGFAVDIAGQWKYKYSGQLATFYFLEGQFAVNVDDESQVPFITFGQVTLGSLLIALLGSALNVPWILDTIQKRKKKRHTSPVSSPNTSSRLAKKRAKKSHKATHHH